jgi:hypothetical protein
MRFCFDRLDQEHDVEEELVEGEEECDAEEAELETEVSSGSFFLSERDSSFARLSSHLIGVRCGV